MTQYVVAMDTLIQVNVIWKSKDVVENQIWSWWKKAHVKRKTKKNGTPFSFINENAETLLLPEKIYTTV